MVDSVANVLLETLRDLLVEEVNFLSRVGDEVKKFESDLKIIHGLLMDADRKQSDSPTLKVCIDELKDLASKAENVIEKYVVEVGSKKGGNLKKKLKRLIGILCECYSVHQAGSEIDDIKSRLAEVTNKLSSVNEGEGSSNAARQEQQRQMRLRYAHEIEQHFVGMETDIDSVVSMLKDESRRSVISICGMGGLGKTTLARKIYHHQDIRQRFGGRRIWVCVTQQFEASAVLRQIIKQVDKNRTGIDGMELCDLVRELHSVLEQECLIVIDDIWESPHWAILKPTFPSNCKMLLTTRNENIEEVASQEFRVHKLDFLSEDEGWELLKKIVLPINDDATTACSIVSKSMEDEGRLIVQKCGRLPLAISVIGGILRQKQQIVVEWKNVRSNIESYLKNGGGIGNDVKGIQLVLDLSFDVLPYYLKSCFLYLACFPEDHYIGTEQLYRLWMAEGFISSEEKENGESLRDVAERYLTELAYRCMVQVERNEDDFSYTKFTSCKLHDLMRDLCSSKAVENKFLKRIEISKHDDIPSIERLAVINLENRDSALSRRSCRLEFKDLRSFLFLTRYYVEVNVENIVNLAKSKYLKILMFNDLRYKEGKLPSAVSKLIHIRYLGLYGCYVKELPDYVCKLLYINTLDLRVHYSVVMKLPNLIWKMKRLRHLFLREEIEVIGGDKLRLEGLDDLETLEGICSETTCIADVCKLINLRVLRATIKDMESLSDIVEYMISGNERKLRETHLDVESIDFGGREEGRSVVKKMLMSPSLMTLKISRCCGNIECAWPCYEQGMCTNLVDLVIRFTLENRILNMEELGKYPILQSLSLSYSESYEEMRYGANSFPELKRLVIFEFYNLKKWEVEQGAMPKLRNLEMIGLGKLEKLPDALRFIPTLRRLRCYNASSELKERMNGGGEGREAGADYANFSHIPDIQIKDIEDY